MLSSVVKCSFVLFDGNRRPQPKLGHWNEKVYWTPVDAIQQRVAQLSTTNDLRPKEVFLEPITLFSEWNIYTNIRRFWTFFVKKRKVFNLQKSWNQTFLMFKTFYDIQTWLAQFTDQRKTEKVTKNWNWPEPPINDKTKRPQI